MTPSLNAFIRKIQDIPFIPVRVTNRLVNYLLSKEKSEFMAFFDELKSLREQIILCDICHGWREKDSLCLWCGPQRDQSVICVVETWIDAMAFERSGIYRGTYHMLGGAISPLEGITPDLLNFSSLLVRCKTGIISELLIATNQTPEGDATSFYIERLCKEHGISVVITCLASGVPVGSSLEFIDRVTLGKAFSFRRNVTL